MIREMNIIKEQIAHFNLDLTDLIVITECASGYYAYNIFVPLLSNARRVIAVSKTTRYGTFKDNKKNIESLAKKLNIDISRLEIVEELKIEQLENADIITNTGHVRPITDKMMSYMKKTAVIPLMWETWEFREEDLDLISAIKNDILVLGTNETSYEIDMRGYSSSLALALLVYLKLEINKTKVILFGEAILGKAIAESFVKNNVDFLWFVDKKKEDNQIEYKDLNLYKDAFKKSDAIIYAELEYHDEILSDLNGLSLKELKILNSEIKLGVIAGNLNQIDLDKLNFQYYPDKILPSGYMSFQPYHMGAKPVIELYSAGLKIGEQMSRYRINQISLEDTIKFITTKSFGMDFIGKSYMDRYREIRGAN